MPASSPLCDEKTPCSTAVGARLVLPSWSWCALLHVFRRAGNHHTRSVWCCWPLTLAHVGEQVGDIHAGCMRFKKMQVCRCTRAVSRSSMRIDERDTALVHQGLSVHAHRTWPPRRPYLPRVPPASRDGRRAQALHVATTPPNTCRTCHRSHVVVAAHTHCLWPPRHPMGREREGYYTYPATTGRVSSRTCPWRHVAVAARARQSASVGARSAAGRRRPLRPDRAEPQAAPRRAWRTMPGRWRWVGLLAAALVVAVAGPLGVPRGAAVPRAPDGLLRRA